MDFGALLDKVRGWLGLGVGMQGMPKVVIEGREYGVKPGPHGAAEFVDLAMQHQVAQWAQGQIEHPDNRVARLRGEAVVTSDDDGGQQIVVSKKVGSAAVEGERTKPVLELTPWRTFREVPQPVGYFYLRFEGGGGKEELVPSIALHELGGGEWKLAGGVPRGGLPSRRAGEARGLDPGPGVSLQDRRPAESRPGQPPGGALAGLSAPNGWQVESALLGRAVAPYAVTGGGVLLLIVVSGIFGAVLALWLFRTPAQLEVAMLRESLKRTQAQVDGRDREIMQALPALDRLRECEAWLDLHPAAQR